MDIEKKFSELIEKYREMGLERSDRYLLLTPHEALNFLDEVITIGIDRGITGIDFWLPHPEGGYFNNGSPLDFDHVLRNKNFVENTYKEAKTFLESVLDDSSVDCVVLGFETDKYREKRLDHFKKNKEQ